MIVSKYWWLAVVIMTLSFCLSGCATTRIVDDVEEPTWFKEMNEALDTQNISLHFTGTQLYSVAVFLSDLTDMTYVLDIRGTGQHPTVDVRCDKVKMRDALNQVAEVSNTKWCVKDEVIYIGSEIGHLKYAVGPDGKEEDWPENLRNIIDKRLVKELWWWSRFEPAPLSKALSDLKETTGLDFVREDKDHDPLITSLDARYMTLRTCLDWLARLSRTQWDVMDGAIRFSKNTRASRIVK